LVEVDTKRNIEWVCDCGHCEYNHYHEPTQVRYFATWHCIVCGQNCTSKPVHQEIREVIKIV
jgi:hypothetical protein